MAAVPHFGYPGTLRWFGWKKGIWGWNICYLDDRALESNQEGTADKRLIAPAAIPAMLTT